MEQDRDQNTSDSTSGSTTTREGATPTDADDARREDTEDEHAATPVGGDSTDDTHEATAVGGGTIYSTATDDATEEPLDASGMQPSGGGANVRRPPGTDIRGEPIPGYEEGAGSTDSSDSSYAVREGVTRAIDDDISTMRTDVDVTGEATHTRVESVGGFNPDTELARPPDLPHSVDVTNVAPDGTTIGGSTLTSPTGEAVGGSTLSDDIRSQAGELGGDALGRGFDFDPLSPGTNETGAGASGGGDADLDRMLMGHDGSLYSAPKELPVFDPDAPPRRTLPKEDQPAPKEDRLLPDWMHDVKDYLVPPKEEPPKPKEVYTENPDADSGDNVTNLERVTVMQGSQVQPSNNPDDPATGAESTDSWIPPADLETMPAHDGEAADTTLTSAATLGSSPLTNPTDPVLGDDGIIAGGTYGGSVGNGGDTLDSMTAMSAGDASAFGGEGEANLPITVRTGPAGGGSSALGGEGDANLPAEPAPAGAASVDALGAGDTSSKMDANNVSVDMATGQVVGSVAPALGSEPNSSMMGDDAALAIGASDATFSDESLGTPEGIEGPPPMGEEPPPDPDDS